MAEDFWTPRCERPDDLVRPVRIDPTGLTGPTRGRARGPGWRRTSHGWLVPSSTDGAVVEQRILEQAVRLPEGAALTAWSSLRWCGARYFDGTRDGRALPVAFVLGGWRDLGRDAGIDVSRERFWWHELEVVGGVACAIPERALFDAVRRCRGRRDAVVAVEMTVASGLTSPGSFADYVALRSGWTGVPFVREVLPWVAEGSRSPQETRMRLVWEIDAGLPRPLVNVPVYDRAGALLGVPDLLDPVAGVVGEYDGQDHLEHDRRRSDARREQRFRDHGLEYVELVRGDLQDRPAVVRRMVATRARARFLPEGDRAWTLAPPAWWSAA